MTARKGAGDFFDVPAEEDQAGAKRPPTDEGGGTVRKMVRTLPYQIAPDGGYSSRQLHSRIPALELGGWLEAKQSAVCGRPGGTLNLRMADRWEMVACCAGEAQQRVAGKLTCGGIGAVSGSVTCRSRVACRS